MKGSALPRIQSQACLLANAREFRHHRRMHMPVISKRKTSAIAGALAFIGSEGSVSLPRTAIIRKIKGR